MGSFYELMEVIKCFCKEHNLKDEDGALLITDILKILDISLSDDAVREIEMVVKR